MRVANTLAAVGDTLDWATIHADECDAHRLLYTNLDKEQRAMYRQLVSHGILDGVGSRG